LFDFYAKCSNKEIGKMITQSCVPSAKYMGYVGNCGENLVPDCQWLSFEPKLRTLVPFGCLVVCYIDLSGH
jgi:hypothetical protein